MRLGRSGIRTILFGLVAASFAFACGVGLVMLPRHKTSEPYQFAHEVSQVLSAREEVSVDPAIDYQLEPRLIFIDRDGEWKTPADPTAKVLQERPSTLVMFAPVGTYILIKCILRHHNQLDETTIVKSSITAASGGSWKGKGKNQIYVSVGLSEGHLTRPLWETWIIEQGRNSEKVEAVRSNGHVFDVIPKIKNLDELKGLLGPHVID